MDDPPVWGLGEGLTNPYRKTSIFYEKDHGMLRGIVPSDRRYHSKFLPTSLRSVLIRHFYVSFTLFIGHEGPQGEQSYSSTLSRTSALDGVVGVSPTARQPLPLERPGTHFTGGQVGPRSGLEGRKISSAPGFHHGPSSSWSVAIPTELSAHKSTGCIRLSCLSMYQKQKQ